MSAQAVARRRGMPSGMWLALVLLALLAWSFSGLDINGSRLVSLPKTLARMFSTNSGAIRSQSCKNLSSTSRFLATVPILGQSPSQFFHGFSNLSGENPGVDLDLFAVF